MFTERDIYQAALHLLATSVNASYGPKQAVENARALAKEVEDTGWLARLDTQLESLEGQVARARDAGAL
jgi:hypothetical protein